MCNVYHPDCQSDYKLTWQKVWHFQSFQYWSEFRWFKSVYIAHTEIYRYRSNRDGKLGLGWYVCTRQNLWKHPNANQHAWSFWCVSLSFLVSVYSSLVKVSCLRLAIKHDRELGLQKSMSASALCFWFLQLQKSLSSCSFCGILLFNKAFFWKVCGCSPFAWW